MSTRAQDSVSAPSSVFSHPGMPRLLLTVAATFFGFGLLLPISPDWVASHGGGELGSGLTTAVLMLTTIATQLRAGWLLRRFGWARILMAGTLLLGLASPVQALTANLPLVLASSAVRGVGFGILTVCAATALTLLVPESMRGRAVGAYGLAVALPQLVATSAGPWLVLQFGTPLVLVLGVVPAAASLWVIPLGRRLQLLSDARTNIETGAARNGGVLRRIWRALLPLVAITTAGGAVLTFATQLTASPAAASLFLLLFTGAAVPARWLSGALTERAPLPALILGTILIGATGIGAIAFGVHLGIDAMPLLGVGGALLGIAYGGAQTVTLVAALQLARPGDEERVSTAWNVAFDAGTGIGGLLIGALAQGTGFTTALAILGVATVGAACVVLRWRGP